jgi:Dual-action HEIGH metallo-peptidase
MRKIVGLFTIAAGAAVLMVACNKKADVNTAADALKQDEVALIKAAGFNTGGATVVDGKYLIEGDILLSADELRAIAGSNNNSPELIIANEEHYRTTNLVRGLPRTLRIGLTSGFATKFSNALDIAVSRYNNENLQIRFQRVFSGTADIVIRSFNQGPNPDGTITLGQAAGFPTSSGNPASGFSLNVNSRALGSSAATTNYVATVMAHEIGHCIGFRHTDYMNRSFSCGGTAVNEGSAGVGAIFIPGTPSGPDANSWMLACSGGFGTNRPFTANDRIALNNVY